SQMAARCWRCGAGSASMDASFSGSGRRVRRPPQRPCSPYSVAPTATSSPAAVAGHGPGFGADRVLPDVAPASTLFSAQGAGWAGPIAVLADHGDVVISAVMGPELLQAHRGSFCAGARDAVCTRRRIGRVGL